MTRMTETIGTVVMFSYYIVEEETWILMGKIPVYFPTLSPTGNVTWATASTFWISASSHVKTK